MFFFDIFAKLLSTIFQNRIFFFSIGPILFMIRLLGYIYTTYTML